MPKIVIGSDAICVGSLSPSRTNVDPHFLQLRVQQTLKGKLVGEDFDIYDESAQYRALPISHALVFLHGRDNTWGINSSTQYPILDLGKSASVEIPGGLLPLDAVLLAIAHGALSDIRPQDKVNLLLYMATVRDLLPPYYPPGPENFEKKKEADVLLAFCNNAILPVLRRLDNDEDLDVRIRAYWVQAIFQDTTILTQLRQFTERQAGKDDQKANIYFTTQAISKYFEPTTVGFMVNALGSSSEQVRIAAAGSLAHSLGTVAIPKLIDQLIDPVNMNKVAFAQYLYEASGQMKPDDEDPQAYINYWKQWEQTHAAEVERDRAKMKAIQSENMSQPT